MNEKIEMIDVTPTWESLMPLFFDWIENGIPSQREMAKSEIMKIAKAIDCYNKED